MSFKHDFSKQDLEKLCDTKSTQLILIEEFEHLMSETNCPDEYIMDLFISDTMRYDYVVEKV